MSDLFDKSIRTLELPRVLELLSEQVWAMGGEARLCMNILMFPEHLPFDTVQAILRGGYDKAAEAEAIVVGGHTIKDDIPKYGLCVSGVVHPDRILRNNSCLLYTSRCV